MKTSWYIERALSAWPATRDSDRKLLMAVWYLQDNDYAEHFTEFFKHKAIMPETITRARRKLQEQGKYRASSAAEADRYAKYKDMRDIAPRTDDVDDVMDILN